MVWNVTLALSEDRVIGLDASHVDNGATKAYGAHGCVHVSVYFP